MSATGNDYAELCDLGLSRWSSRRNFETDDLRDAINAPAGAFLLNDPYGAHTRMGSSTNSLRNERSGNYYSPPGTSYTIVERPHSPHYYFNTAGVPSKGGSLPGRGSSSYLQAHPSTHLHNMNNVAPTSGSFSNYTSRHSGDTKKLPISPEQVLQMFGTTTSSASGPSNFPYSNGTKEDTDRRSPSNNPPVSTQQIYKDRRISSIHELSTRTVSMSRDQKLDVNHGFGICVKGERDTGLGVYISRVEENSVAERAGLRPGDTILEVNGTPFTSLNHEDALKRCVQILKSSRQISMTVRTPTKLNSSAPLHGFGPPLHDAMYSAMSPPHAPLAHSSIMPPMGAVGIPFRQTCSWMDRHGRPVSPPCEYDDRRNPRRDRIRRVELVIEPGQSLGLMIRGGVEYGLGIFVTGVDKESVADRAGLAVGDEIIEVNGQSFLDVTHDEAVSQLKYHKRMLLVLRDVGKVPHSCTSIEMEPWEVYSSTGSRARRKGHITTMVEEKARSLLPRHHFVSLSYYIAEYSAKAMAIDAFVAVLLEMLDTYEKHTLVTEVRELIYPEDRTRYDELVYRRDRDLQNHERPREYDFEEHRTRRRSETQLAQSEYDQDVAGYLEGLRSHLGGLTQRVKSWYWGRPLELATKLSRSFDMKDEVGSLGNEKGVRRHQSMQRLSTEQNSLMTDKSHEHNPNVVPDSRGNLQVTVKKTKPILGIAIEGGANTKHPLPRIINIHENGAAFEAGGLEVGQLILQVDGNKVEGLHHQEVARLIAECFSNREKADITFLVIEAKKSNLEPKPTALIFLEA